ncbi:hypothetical protein GJA_5530 [Janthinobacterium agaricidamnosum NBRC 102515 = DSM 9628]|uniref:Uncharacterized protein n=1 Tax=Janthinobacterium agaricidamnosum NBRC 102515 = DSM 9628 TaxID=1349767 RepID=W0VDW0_9BURK|nr:hypothetical protein GJA_5530 [Janthinobacterium agaricidamnosum NBRC 102515 = DSM 9628]
MVVFPSRQKMFLQTCILLEDYFDYRKKALYWLATVGRNHQQKLLKLLIF